MYLLSVVFSAAISEHHDKGPRIDWTRGGVQSGGGGQDPPVEELTSSATPENSSLSTRKHKQYSKAQQVQAAQLIPRER